MMEETTYTRCETRNYDFNISETIEDFERLRISALTNAAEISPYVKEVTIGPKSPSKNQIPDHNPTPHSNKQDVVELIDDKIGNDLRYTLILKSYETRLEENSEEFFKNLVDKMISTYAETMHNYWKKQSDECKRKSVDLRARKLQMVKQMQENDNLIVLERATLDEHNYQIISQQTIENMNRLLDEQNTNTIRFTSIIDSHTKICICYNELSSLIQSEPFLRENHDKYILPVNTVMGNINLIMDFCKTGTITDNEVKQAELLYIKIENIKCRINEDLMVAKQEEIKRRQKEEDTKQREIEENQAREAKAIENIRIQEALAEKVKRAHSMFYSEKNYTYYKQLKHFLDNYESNYKDLLEDTNFKRFRFDCQKAVNTPINALSSVSGTHMRDKFDKLAKLLRGETQDVLDTSVTATQHPQGLKYCTALLAKKIVQQGSLLVSSNPEAAFPLAAVVVALWSQFPEFGKLLEAYFHKFCPYLVPMLAPQIEGQSDKDFYLSRGYIYSEDGAVEKQDKFLKRMSGIFKLCCAIWIAKTPKFINASNPHGLCFAWQWLASFINLKAEPDISATLIHDFFTVCGSEFLKHYKKQAIKIIKLLTTDYLNILENIDEGGPKTRFEVFMQNVLKTGHIPAPSGLLPPNTW